MIDTKLGMRAVEFARQSIGVREDPPGSNWGQAVRAYLHSVGIATPAPWCAAFVNYKVRQAAQALGETPKWPATAWCPDIAHWAAQTGHLLLRPVPGCVFLVRTPQGGYRHTGFVAAVNTDATVSTIEGNTGPAGSPEGIGVFARRRSVKGLVFVLPA